MEREEQADEARTRPQRPREAPRPPSAEAGARSGRGIAGRRAGAPGGRRGDGAPSGGGEDERTAQRDGRLGAAAAAARTAAAAVAELTGHRPETVVSIQPADGGWTIGVEVVETERIPDTADILAIYEVVLDAGGELKSYRRTSRYARGQLSRDHR